MEGYTHAPLAIVTPAGNAGAECPRIQRLGLE